MTHSPKLKHRVSCDLDMPTLKVPEKYRDENTTFRCPRCKQKLLFSEAMCGSERPARKVFCQLKKGHVGSHRAIIFWED
jgi:hypothetical protein